MMLKCRRALIPGLIAVVGAVAGGTFMLPSEIEVERHTTIVAPPEKVFSFVGDLKRFSDLSPWVNPDLGLHYSFKGPPVGVGQAMSWNSDNPTIGRGSQEIISYQPPTSLAMTVSLSNGRAAKLSISLEPVGGGTRVTWRFKSRRSGPLQRWLGILDIRRIGDDMERALAKLEMIAEK
ncbi:MAG: SRPBCC family protein [Pseudomonadota bacterium]